MKTDRRLNPTHNHWKVARAHLLPDVAKLRACGTNVLGIAKALGIGTGQVRSCLSDLGVAPVPNDVVLKERAERAEDRGLESRMHHHQPVSELFSRGYPVLRIARELGIGRAKVLRCMDDLGLQAPSRSEANRKSAALTAPEARAARVQAAHQAIRINGRSDVTNAGAAMEHADSQVYVGFGEAEVCDALRARGLDCTPQFAWKRYNIDIMAGKVAVEIHHSVSRPMYLAQRLRRTIELLCAGISVCYLWISPRDRGISETAIEHVVAFHHLTCSNPSATGQYRVIRGNGKIDFTSNRQLDELAAVVALYRPDHTVG